MTDFSRKLLDNKTLEVKGLTFYEMDDYIYASYKSVNFKRINKDVDSETLNMWSTLVVNGALCIRAYLENSEG